MAASSRTVYGREFVVTSTWVWMAQRASGLVLGPLVALHIWAPNLAGNRVLNALLLLIIIAHGFTGVRRIDNGKDVATRYKVIAAVWSFLVLALGTAIVIA